MNILFFVVLFFSPPMMAGSEYYPEERTYVSRDRGFHHYLTPSLRQSSQYALTFDDGPHFENTPKILDVLKKYQAKATFFVVTERINRQTRSIIQRMLDEGHILASHGHVHHNSNDISEDLFVANLKTSLDVLKIEWLKAPTKIQDFYYRFPYAAYGAHPDYHHLNSLRELSYDYFGDNCLQFAFWDIDSGDWIPGMTSEEVFQNIKANHEGGTFISFKIRRENGRTFYDKVYQELKNPLGGGVVLLHDIQQKSIKAIDSFLKYAEEKNIEIVPLSQVEEYRSNTFCELTTLF